MKRSKRHIVIAIDGPAASGKGTLARALAARLGYAHMDTGALYRAVAFEVLQAGGDCGQESDALIGCERLQEALRGPQGLAVLANKLLRSEAVAEGASVTAAFPSVREALVSVQRGFAEKPGKGFSGAVLDGRDIGTVICPQADVKLFVTAETEIRAERRKKELQSKGIEAKYEAVLADMRNRDERDSGRKAAPLRPADDAVLLDTTGLSAEEALDKALQIVEDVLNR